MVSKLFWNIRSVCVPPSQAPVLVFTLLSPHCCKIMISLKRCTKKRPFMLVFMRLDKKFLLIYIFSLTTMLNHTDRWQFLSQFSFPLALCLFWMINHGNLLKHDSCLIWASAVMWRNIIRDTTTTYLCLRC